MKTIRFGLLMLFCSASLMLAQNAKLIVQVEPYGDQAKPVIAEVGKTIHFIARVFEMTAAGVMKEVPADRIAWSVNPPSFGTISPNGDFAVGSVTPPGMNSGAVVAHVTVKNMTLTGTSFIVLGRGPIDQHLDYTITGKVADESGNAIAGSIVFTQNTNTPNTAGISAVTKSDGTYELKVPAGKYFIGVKANGFVMEFYDNVYTPDKATLVVTDPNKKNIDNINFTLGTGGKVSGKVTAAADGSPIQGAMVNASWTISSHPSSGSNFLASAITDVNGEYTITGLGAGKYIIQANAKGYSLQYYDKASDFKSAKPVDVVDNQTTSNINFALDKWIDPTGHFTISGKVTDESNNPIAGAEVSGDSPMSNQPGVRKFYAKTDQDGKYTLNVPGGSYLVHAGAPGFLPEYYDNVRKPDQATKVVVSSTEPAKDNINFILGKGGKISGKVVKASDATPIKGAFISVYSDMNKPPILPGSNASGVQTNDQGEYLFEGLATDKYIVIAHKDGFEDQFYNKVDKPDQATKVDVTEGQTTSNIDFELVQLAGISGKVTDADDGKPIAKAQVIIGDMRANLKPLVAFTDQNGEYHLALPAGSYKPVQASAPMYSPEWYNEKNDPTQADEVVVTKGVVTQNINFTLERWGGGISGVVKDDAGNPIDHATVKIWSAPMTTNPSTKRFFVMAVSGADGSYEIKNIPGGKYLVYAGAKGFIIEFYNNAPDIKTAAEVTVVNKQTTTGIDFSLSKGGNISGTVTDVKTNNPIPGAFVSIRNNVSLVEMGAKTDVQGNYTLGGLPTGDYIVFAMAPRYKGEFYKDVIDPKLATPVSVTAPNTTTGIDFALELGPPIKHKITGSVVDAVSQMPLQLTFIEAIDPVTGQTTVTTTNPNGQFEIDANTGAIIRARAIDYVGSYAGGNTNWNEGKAPVNGGLLDFALSPMAETGFATLRGSVIDETSRNPIPNTWVYGQDTEGNTFFSVSNHRGEFAIANTSYGSVNLMISGVQYEQTQETKSVDGTSNPFTMTTRKASGTTGVDKPDIPNTLALEQNYPNPFSAGSFGNPSTSISFSLPVSGKVSLKVYNLLGNEITTLVNGYHDAANYTVIWNAEKIPSGIYLYKLEFNGSSITRRMTLLK